MSRFKRFVHSLVSGYAVILGNILYTLASVPLALHYLTKEEFGLWVLVTQVCNFNTILVDLGMSGAIARILIDHKDDAASSRYGTVILTGSLALLVQGTIIVGVSWPISYWLPHWMEVPEASWRIFRILVFWQCVMLAFSYVLRIFSFILQAHQRYDVCNYANLGSFAVGLAGMWLGFATGWGLYSLLVGGVVSAVFTGLFGGWQAWRLRLFPRRGRWGRPEWGAFKELFFYGMDMFLASIGLQLIIASQAPLITRTLGLEAAAVWSIATKLFVLAQQVVYRLLDFSTAAFSEMMVRGERARLQARFRDLVLLSGAAGAAVGVAMALCNRPFLEIWTKHRISWPIENDALMAVSLFVFASTRCHLGLACMTKEIRGLKFSYLGEGVAFVVSALLIAPKLGLTGVIICSICTNLIFSGVYGVYRTTGYFRLSVREVVFDWMRQPMMVLMATAVVALGCWYATGRLAALTQLLLCALLIALTAAGIFWKIGLPADLRAEALSHLAQLRSRFPGSEAQTPGRKNV